MKKVKKAHNCKSSKKLFDEIKVKMVMKIHNLSEREAVAKSRKNKNAVWKENRGIVCCPDDDLLSAEECFL